MKYILILLSVLFVACTPKTEKVSFNTVEDARKQVRDNVSTLAQKFRADNKLTDYDLYVRGDSTQSAECPQGDGWASVDLQEKTTGKVIKLKCSTVSSGIGCMTAEDFKTKRYAQEEDHCSKDIPFPLPKVAL